MSETQNHNPEEKIKDPVPEGIRPRIFELIEVGPNHRSIRQDALNGFFTFLSFLRNPDRLIATIRKNGFTPINHYTEYHEKQLGYTKCEIDYLLKYSNPESVKIYNDIVDVLNDVIPKITHSHDEEQVNYINEAKSALRRLSSLHEGWRYIENL